jgi:SAM-dependent methyltransferase
VEIDGVKTDIRLEAAQFYDLNPSFPPDVPFYRDLLPSPHASVLELGCGTGRVTTALASHCAFLQGIDISAAMVDMCRSKIAGLSLPSGRVTVSVGDISGFDLGRKFEFIIAPFRVLQNLETTAQVDGLLACVRRHLARDGTCILNAFNPHCGPDELRETWLLPGERLNWETVTADGKVACYDRRVRFDKEQLIVYPDLVYRHYRGSILVREVVLHIAMRCYYPETFEQLILDHRYEIANRWGGYQGEQYGKGPELVLQFRVGA